MRNSIKTLFITMLVFLFSACDPSSFSQESDDSNVSVSLGGIVVDGYISGATVCLDLNSNDSCDATEPTTMSDEYGIFSFSSRDFSNYTFIPVIAKGGVDTATNKEFTGELKTIINTSNLSQENTIIINPLTDLVSVSFLRATIQDEVALNDAIKEVADVFALEQKDVLSDPMQNVMLFAKVQEIQHLKELIYTSANKTFVADNGKNLTIEIKEALVTQIKESNNGILELWKVLDTVEIQLSIAIPKNEETFIINQIAEIKRALNIFVADTAIDVNNLGRLQLALENELEEAYSRLSTSREDTTIDIVPITITYAFLTQSIFDKTDAVLDKNACLISSSYKSIADSSFTPDRVSDDENGVIIHSSYEINTTIEATEITFYYTDLEVEKTFDYTIIYKDNYSFSFDQARLDNSNTTVYIRTPKGENNLYECFRAELNSTVAGEIIIDKVFRYKDI